MGGHAFPNLHCPRMPPSIYHTLRDQKTAILRTLFAHVVVPTEMPAKPSHGDIDFLVAGFLELAPAADLDWHLMVSRVKEALETTHGKRGWLNPDVMYFAVALPDSDVGIDEDAYENEDSEGNFEGKTRKWMQIDIKVLPTNDANAFAWATFQLNYASGMKMMGSLVKPLGLTFLPSGLHIRVEEMEATDWSGSLVFITNDAKVVLRILGLDRRFLHAGFSSAEEIYRYFASSWLFNPSHYASRLAEGSKYRTHIAERSTPWVDFLTQWLPTNYPGYLLPNTTTSLEEWQTQARTALSVKVFTLFPSVAAEYYRRRSAHVRTEEEARLRRLLSDAIPVGLEGWSDDITRPRIIVQDATTMPSTPLATPRDMPPTPPLTPPSSILSDALETYANEEDFSVQNPLLTPLLLPFLPHCPPLPLKVRPPPADMSQTAKLLCLARWTSFDPITGTPFLLKSPRRKGFEFWWQDSGVQEEVVADWLKKVWWGVWERQGLANFVGMWKRRLEKEETEREKERLTTEQAKLKREETNKEQNRRAKILERLKRVSKC